MNNHILGIDVGGTGIKGALVDIDKGELISERFKIETPRPATPKVIAGCIKDMVNHFEYKGAIGCGFPTIISEGKAGSFGNMHPTWKGVQVDELFSNATGLKVTVANDADVAGICEMRLGAGKGKMNKIVLITIGTGLGSAVFYKGKLVPNIELGYMPFNGKPIERYASNTARKRDELTYEEWGVRFDFFLQTAQRVVYADEYILGGGTCKRFELYKDKLTLDVPIYPAEYLNNAGIVGAALLVNE